MTVMTTPKRELPLAGHRNTSLGRSPFWAAAPGIVAALGYLVAAGIWVGAGDALPGGRWLAVHLFTLGVLSNLILTFSQHFGHTVTRSPGDGSRVTTAVFNVGVLGVIVAIPTGVVWLLGLGATVATGAVMDSYRRIRAARRAAVGARFAWIARVYERAHGSFVHGAILGALLGLGLLPGAWAVSGRLAHLHVNVLGWGVLTLLATVVFFGPTMVRTRIAEGADATASRALKHGATALTIGVLAMLATAVGGTLGTLLELVTVVSMAGFAAAATVVVLPVVGAALEAKPSAPRLPLVATSLWLVGLVWADVVLIASGAWTLLPLVGTVALVGVLLQAILATLTYLAPMLRGRSFATRDLLIARLEKRSTARTVAFNTGIVVILSGGLLHAAGADGAALTQIGWALVGLAVAHQMAAGLRPLGPVNGDTAVSSVARRYRTDPPTD